MRRTNLDKGLQELDSHIMHLGSQVEQTLIKALTALETGDFTHLSDLIEADAEIDIDCVDIEKQALRLLLLQQPLAGQDMRFLIASLHISNDLSRISDTIVEIAEALLKIASLSLENGERKMIDHRRYAVPIDAVDQYGNMTDVFIIRGLLDLGKEITYRLQQTIKSFTARDHTIARHIEMEHDPDKSRYMALYNDILNMQAQTSALSTLQYDASIVQRATYFLWIAHKLEQIAIYLTNICKRIIFIVEGHKE